MKIQNDLCLSCIINDALLCVDDMGEINETNPIKDIYLPPPPPIKKKAVLNKNKI